MMGKGSFLFYLFLLLFLTANITLANVIESGNEDNIIDNHCFEEAIGNDTYNASGWLQDKTADATYRTNETAKCGTWALKQEHITKSYSRYFKSNLFELEAGDKYNLSGYYKVTNQNSHSIEEYPTLFPRIQFFNETGNYLDKQRPSRGLQAKKIDEWAYFQKNIDVPEGAVYGRLKVTSRRENDVDVSIYWDNFYLEIEEAREEEDTDEEEEGSEKIERIDINNATAEELTEITNIGEKTAKYIIENCKQFHSLTQLVQVKGLGKTTVRQIIEEGEAYVMPPADDEWSPEANVCDAEDADKKDVNKSSKIEIIDATKQASFGETIDINIDVYRNDTRKYAIYAFVRKSGADLKISEESVTHLKNTEEEYRLRIPVSIASNCNREYSNGTYQLVVEGLGAKDVKEIEIEGVATEACQEISIETEEIKEEESLSLPEFELLSAQDELVTDETITNKVLLENRYEEEKSYQAYSYIYKENTPINERGWIGNSKNFTIEPETRKTIELENTIRNDVDTGNYTLTVRIRNETDLTKDVAVLNKNFTKNRSHKDVEIDIVDKDEITGKTIRRRTPIDRIIERLTSILPF